MSELLAKYFSGNLSESEKKEVLTWRNENQQNAEEFFEFASAWNQATLIENNSSDDTDSVFKAILSRSNKEDKVVDINSNFNFKTYLKYAAVVLLAVLGSYVYINTSTDLTEVATGKGEVRNLTLSDGSIVYLNENSSVSYNATLSGDTREVLLTGKAFFEVKRDATKPFIVKTNDSEIRVLGTSFLVDANSIQKHTEVVVATGKVAVSSLKLKKDNKVELVPGDVGKVTLSGKSVEKYKNENPNYLSWKTKVLNFNKASLNYVFDVLEETYHLDIDVSNSTINDCKLSAKYDNQSIESIMEIMSETFNLNMEKVDSDSYKVSGEGCTTSL
ncbi:FecR family protein [Reichenbachiella sp. MALMAid0571]|uniref:FecR family protein n=1 Tax=Reichenbachiella sp. MALMAid0571 TaxID=3143939 RepID=UPI0032E041E3